MLSLNIGTENSVPQAKKQKQQQKQGAIDVFFFFFKLQEPTDVALAQWFFVVVFFNFFYRLFHAQIVPSLLYATEIWSDRENKQIELVHLYTCKVFITIPTVTPDDII